MRWVLAAGLGYLLGSIPWGLVLTRLAGSQDPRGVGSGNVGATNVARAGGLTLGVLTLALDAAKGLAATLLFASTARELAAVAGLAAVVGHCFPAWLGLRGGKGVATLWGISAVLGWPFGFVAFTSTWIALFAFTRWASVASLSAAGAAVLVTATSGGAAEAVGALAAAALLVLVRHHENLRRLGAGREPRFGDPPADRDASDTRP